MGSRKDLPSAILPFHGKQVAAGERGLVIDSTQAPGR
jgi:hypothetical protein